MELSGCGRRIRQSLPTPRSPLWPYPQARAGCSPNSLIEYWRKSRPAQEHRELYRQIILAKWWHKSTPWTFDTGFKRDSTAAPNSILKSALVLPVGPGVFR